MCGIAGVVDFRKKTVQSNVEEMTRLLGHRGPDGEGYYCCADHSAMVGLGHRRLSIIDLSCHASQPMHYKDLHISFNGEIYNYAEIKSELSIAGHSFTTGSDTEVILHAYEEWGAEMVKRFIGMFALVIYDTKEQKLVAFRDRVGVKPFFYYFDGDLFLFSSELKAFHAHPGFNKRLNHDAMAAFFQYGNIPAPYCIFENTFKLPPAHYLVMDIASKQMDIHRYWSVYDSYNRPCIKIDYQEALNETEKVFTKAFNYRMVADVPVGVFLSAGYDSGCVTALLQKERTDPIRTFTIGTTDKLSDEAPLAKQIAEHLRTDHTEYYCTPDEAKAIIPILADYFDEPFADSSAVPTILVSRLARQKVTVALSADGGDEIFGGYPKYQFLHDLQQRLARVPGAIRSTGRGVMGLVPLESIPIVSRNKIFINKYSRLRSLLRDPSLVNVFLSANQLFTQRELDQLLRKDFKVLPTPHTSRSLKSEFYDPYSYMMAIDYETYLTDDIMQKVDRASMSIGLESREPFLDQNIIHWAAQLPVEFKLGPGKNKQILKEIVHRYIPREMMERPKKGFTIPVAKWLKNDFRELVYQMLGDDHIKNQGIFNLQTIKQLRDGFYTHGKVPAEKIWYLLMFQLWFSKWMAK